MANDPHDWMWSEALSMLARAERMHQQMFTPVTTRRQVAWEPPVDVLETEREVLVLAALPGVDVAKVEAAIEGATLIISGTRVLPPGRYEAIRRAEAHGCLVISLSKATKP